MVKKKATMSDYISKSALKSALQLNNKTLQTTLYGIIDCQPTIDLVPCPVRCGECEYEKECQHEVVTNWSLGESWEVSSCSHGKRKEK